MSHPTYPTDLSDEKRVAGRLARFAWLPIPVLLAAIVACRVAGLADQYENAALRLVLSSSFYTLVSLGTLFLLARSFLVSGAPGLLLLECGVILWALAGTVGDLVYHGVTNTNVTIFNSAMLLAGMCHLGGALLSLKPGRTLGRRPLWLAAGVAVSLAALTAIVWAALTGRMPAFFIPKPGPGATPVRYAVLAAAIVMFLASIALLNVRKRARTRFLRWYTFALLSMTVGLFGIMIQTNMGTLVNWLARAAQWLGGLYLLASAIAAVRETGRWEISLDVDAWDDRLLRLLTPYLVWKLPAAWRYGLAVLVVVAAVALRWALLPWLGETVPYNVAMLAVIGAAILLGTGPALVTVVLGNIGVEIFVTKSIPSAVTGESVGRMALVTCIGFLLCWVIHALRAAALKAQRSEERYRQLFSGMTEGFALHEIVLDAGGVPVDYRFIDINPAFERLTGLKRSDLIGRTVREVLPGTERRWIDTYGRVALTGEPTHFEDEHAALGRRYEVFAYRPAPMQFAVVFMDVTEKERAAAALRESEGKYRNLFANMTEEVHFWKLVRDEQGRIVTWTLVDANPPALKTWGRGSVEEVRGKTTDEIFGPGAAEHYMPVVRKVMSEGVPHVYEDYFPNLDKHFRFTTVPLGDYFITTGADVTAIKKAAEALRRANERLTLAQRSAGAGIWDWDMAADRLEWSPEMFGLLGLDPARDKADFDAWRSVLHPDDRKAAGERIRVAVESRSRLQSEYRVVLASGESRWISALGDTVYAADGKPLRMSGICVDITERRRAEEQLAYLASFPGLNPNPIAEIDLEEGSVHYANPAAERLFPDLAARGAEHPWLAGAREKAGEISADSPRVREVTVGAATYRQTLSLTPDRRRLRIYGMDISERKRTEEALRESEARLAHAQQVANLGSWEWNIATGRLIWSDQTFRMMGEEPGRIEPTLAAFLDRVHPEDRAAFDASIARTLAEGLPHDMDVRIVRPGGEVRVFHSHGELVPGPDGKPVRMTGVSLDVTENRQAEEKLRQSEARFRSIFNSNVAALAVWDVEGNLREANNRFLEILGYTREQFEAGQVRWVEATPPELRARDAEAVRDLLAGREIHPYEKQFVRPDGTRMPVLIGGCMLPGQTNVGVAFAVDITLRKRAEAALREERDRLAALLSSIADEIWYADAAGNFALVNPSGAREFALDAGKPADVRDLAQSLEVLRPDGSPRPVEEAPPLRALRGEVVRNEEEIIRTPATGELRHRQVSSSPVRDAGGNIIGSVSVVRDITELKHAEEALARSWKTFSELVERSPFGTYIVDSQFRVAMMNVSSQEGAFRNVRPVIGRDFSEAMRVLWPEPVATEICGHFRRTLDTGEPYLSPRFVNPRADVEIVESYEWELHRMTLPDGQYGVICYYYDSTALRRAEAALVRAKEELEQRVEERTGELAETVLQLEAQVEQRLRVEHDLRRSTEQLRKLASDLTLAEQRERHRLAQVLHDHLQQLLAVAKFRVSPLGYAEHVQAMKEQDVIRLAHDVKGLLDQSIEASRSLTVELSPPILHGGGIVPALEWLARNMEEKHGLEVEVLAADRSTRESEDVTVLLFQAVRELLFNTVKHARVERATVEIARLNEHLRVIVSDKGVGFDPATLRSEESTSGGFGLYSVRERLSLLGGSLDVESAPGRGCRFTLLAPVRGPESDDGRPPVREPAPAHEAPAGVPPAPLDARIRVLVADDHPVMREGLILLLKEAGDVEVVGEASNGEEAVETARRLLPDVVLMDINMPVMNGIEATRVIREEMPQVKVIGLSMSEEPEKSAAMGRAGASAYLTKSGATDTLLGAIRACSGSSRSEDPTRRN